MSTTFFRSTFFELSSRSLLFQMSKQKPAKCKRCQLPSAGETKAEEKAKFWLFLFLAYKMLLICFNDND